MYALVGVCQEYMPVAQTQVLRRVLKGGISTDSGCLVLVLFSTDALCVLERRGLGLGGLVFGTLLGPEATGPVWASFVGVVPGLFVSGFLAAPIMHVVCVGCVVRGCCLRTT